MEELPAGDVDPGVPVVRYVACATEAQCRSATENSGIGPFYAGGGDPAGPVACAQRRVVCEET
jgi:hypothetical protein